MMKKSLNIVFIVLSILIPDSSSLLSYTKINYYEDETINGSPQYTYIVRATDFAGNVSEDYDPVTIAITDVDNSESVIPDNFTLSQNYPNPFNPSTVINYSIPQKSYVKIQIFDMLGRKLVTLVDTEKPAGNYDAEFIATNFSSGVYFYRIDAVPNSSNADYFTETKKMLLIK